MLPDIDEVIRIVREVAAAEILPRFGKLASSDISEKGPGDLVTTADVMAEKRLSAALIALEPGSAVIGEEAADGDASVFEGLRGAAPAWLVDPVDGTHNFAHGKPCFAVIVAYVRGGETVAGWILDPISEEIAWAAAGEGAWLEKADGAKRRLRVAAPAPMAEMRGSLGHRLRRRLAAKGRTGGEVPARLTHYRCAGREYMDLARGDLHFACYARRLKPWDHAAGVLIHREAGGFAALTEGGAPYRPEPGIFPGTLLLAPDQAIWRRLEALLAE